MAAQSVSGRNALYKLLSGHKRLLHRQLCCACITQSSPQTWRRPSTPRITSIRSFSTSITFANDKQPLEFDTDPNMGPEIELETDLETNPEPEIDSRPQPETELEIETETEVDTKTESDLAFLSLPESQESLSESFRRLMRRVPHPVVILTTRHPPSSSNESRLPYYKQICAMTVSSFTSVTLEPHPIISFNMKLPSKTYDALKANDGHFLIHVLQTAEEPAEMAMAFTKGQDIVQQLLTPTNGPDMSQETPFRYRLEGQGPLARTEVTPLERSGGAPALKRAGMFGTISCKLLPEKEMQVQDHVLLCAEVLDCPPERVFKRRLLSKDQPFSMVYVDGAFRSVQNSIILGDKKKKASKQGSSKKSFYRRIDVSLP